MRRNGPKFFDMRLDVSYMQPRDGWMMRKKILAVRGILGKPDR